MNINDDILIQIDNLISSSTDSVLKTKLGYFVSNEDRAYRKEAVEKLFSSLNRDNQNVALKYLMFIAQEQYH